MFAVKRNHTVQNADRHYTSYFIIKFFKWHNRTLEVECSYVKYDRVSVSFIFSILFPDIDNIIKLMQSTSEKCIK